VSSDSPLLVQACHHLDQHARQEQTPTSAHYRYNSQFANEGASIGPITETDSHAFAGLSPSGSIEQSPTADPGVPPPRADPYTTRDDDESTNRQETIAPSQEHNQNTRIVASNEDRQNAHHAQHLAAKDALSVKYKVEQEQLAQSRHLHSPNATQRDATLAARDAAQN
jgi:hypothetical protein